jgi:hypothetical protein
MEAGDVAELFSDAMKRIVERLHLHEGLILIPPRLKRC